MLPRLFRFSCPHHSNSCPVAHVRFMAQSVQLQVVSDQSLATFAEKARVHISSDLSTSSSLPTPTPDCAVPVPTLSNTSSSASGSAPAVARLIAGIDEAGKGACLGPISIAVVALSKETEMLLQTKGVRDSKYLTDAARNRLAEEIKLHAEEWKIIRISAKDIDQRRLSGESINQIEFNEMTALVQSLKSFESKRLKAVVVDAFDVDSQRLQNQFETAVSGTRFVAEHTADSRYVVVAAASILAKADREAAVAEIQSQVGEAFSIGSGYPSDKITQAYVRETIKRARMLDAEIPPPSPEPLITSLSSLNIPSSKSPTFTTYNQLFGPARAPTFLRTSWKVKTVDSAAQATTVATELSVASSISQSSSPASPRPSRTTARKRSPAATSSSSAGHSDASVQGTTKESSATKPAAPAGSSEAASPQKVKRKPREAPHPAWEIILE